MPEGRPTKSFPIFDKAKPIERWGQKATGLKWFRRAPTSRFFWLGSQTGGPSCAEDLRLEATSAIAG
jgi:hypothetical protein